MKDERSKIISVLFADDDQGTLDLLTYQAKTKGWLADTAHNAGEIIKKVNQKCAIEQDCYSIIVADLHYFSNTDSQFPRLTGISAAKSIREIYKDLPIIFITGYSNYLVREAAAPFSDEVIEKPVDVDRLFERIEFYVECYSIKGNTYDRRQKSINLTNNCRRKTDKPVALNSSVVEAIEEVRESMILKAMKNK